MPDPEARGQGARVKLVVCFADGVILANLLEHCPEQDILRTIDELFGFATRFVFANVVCNLVRKRPPSGENAHCTIISVER